MFTYGKVSLQTRRLILCRQHIKNKLGRAVTQQKQKSSCFDLIQFDFGLAWPGLVWAWLDDRWDRTVYGGSLMSGSTLMILRERLDHLQ